MQFQSARHYLNWLRLPDGVPFERSPTVVDQHNYGGPGYASSCYCSAKAKNIECSTDLGNRQTSELSGLEANLHTWTVERHRDEYSDLLWEVNARARLR